MKTFDEWWKEFAEGFFAYSNVESDTIAVARSAAAAAWEEAFREGVHSER